VCGKSDMVSPLRSRGRKGCGALVPGAMSCRSMARMRVRRFLAGLALPSVVLCAGCMHRPLPLKATYTLEDASGYSLLVPSVLPKKVEGEFQSSVITLPGEKRSMDSNFVRRCSIKGPVFSFRPDDSLLGQWLVTSPSVQGWEKLGGEIDLHAEWDRFTHELEVREGLHCFPAGDSLSVITRAVAEKMPIPANESLLFFYSLGATGFADLVPGMQIRFERTLLESRGQGHTASRYRGSVDAQYEVVAIAGGGVGLRLSSTTHRRLVKSLGPEGQLIFHLSTRFATKPRLRIFLESVGNNNAQRSSVLIGASDSADLDAVTREIEGNARGGCPRAFPATVDCVAFHQETAVSLLASLWLNGRLLYRPPGTTVASLVGLLKSDREQARALQTLSLRRPLITGGYAEVVFPRTMESAQQVILLSGDRLAWKK